MDYYEWQTLQIQNKPKSLVTEIQNVQVIKARQQTQVMACQIFTPPTLSTEELGQFVHSDSLCAPEGSP